MPCNKWQNYFCRFVRITWVLTPRCKLIKDKNNPVLWPLYTSTCVSQHLPLRTGGFCQCKVLQHACPRWRQPAHLDKGKDARLQQCCLHCLHTLLSFWHLYSSFVSPVLPSVLWHCCFGSRKGIRPVKTEWWGAGMVICRARCRLAYGPADATATLASVKSRLVLPFWYRLTRVVLDKEPLNGCVCVCCNRKVKPIFKWRKRWSYHIISPVCSKRSSVAKHGCE